MKEQQRACRNCEQYKNCFTFWGNDCRERGGNKIPKFKNHRKAHQEPKDTVAVIVWINGEKDFYTRADLQSAAGRGKH